MKTTFIKNIDGEKGFIMSTTFIKNIDGKWYAFEYIEDHNAVYSIGSDNMRDGAKWFASPNDSGIKYVASPQKTRAAAYRKARKYGVYSGEWK